MRLFGWLRRKSIPSPKPKIEWWRRWYECPACMQLAIETPEYPNHYDRCSYFRRKERMSGPLSCDLAFSELEPRKEERKEPEMSNYTKSAEIAGKLLEHLTEAGCYFPSAALYAEGSGYFIVRSRDKETARQVLDLCLSETGPIFDNYHSERCEFSFNTRMLKTYISVCHTCKRPLEKEAA